MSDNFDKPGKPKKSVVDVKFSNNWNAEDRLNQFKKGVQSSIDEIIVSLHQTLQLDTLDAEKYKAAIEGRVLGSRATKDLMDKLKDIDKQLGNDVGEKFEKKEDFNKGFAEKNAN